MKKPGKVTAIEVMTLVAGVFGLIMGFTIMWATLFLWIPWVYSFVFGIVAIVMGAKLLSSPGYRDGRPPPTIPRPPYFVGVMAIVNVLCCDVTSVTLGILILVFLGDPEVKDYYAGRWVPPPTPVAAYGPAPQPVYPQQPPSPSPEGPPPQPPAGGSDPQGPDRG
jgi:hypothetical protein